MASGGANTRIGIQIQQQVLGNEQVAAAISGSKQLAASVDHLKASSDAASHGAAQLKGSLRGLADGLAAQAGPAGGLIRSLAGINLGAGLAVGAIAAIGGAMLVSAKQIGAFQEQMDIIADQTGLSTREIGGLELGAANVGRSFEQISPSLDIFVRKLADAREGSKEAAASFKGIAIEKSTGEVLQQVAEHLEGIKDPARRARESFELFGRSWRQILPVLTQDMTTNKRQAEEWGLTLSESAEASARRADVAFDKLGQRMKGFMRGMQSDAAAGGTAFANWALGVLGWLDKIEKKLHLKFVIATGGKGEGIPGLSPRQAIDFDDKSQGTAAAVIAPGAKEAEEAQAKAFKAITDQIDGLERLREANRLTIEQEAQQLTTLKDQAIVMADRVTGARALLVIERQIAALLSQRGVQFGPPRPPGGIWTAIDAFGDLPNKTLKPVPVIEEFRVTALDKAIAELNATLTTTATGVIQSGTRIATIMTSAFGQAVTDSLFYGKSMKDGLNNIWKSIRDDFVAAFAQTLAKSVIKGALNFIPGIGPALSEAFPVATGGTLAMGAPIPAQHGLILSGTRGRDTVPVTAQRGEMFVSRQDTDALRAFIRDSRRATPAAEPVVNQTVHLEVTINSNYIDKQSLETHVRNDLAPAIIRVMRSGGHR